MLKIRLQRVGRVHETSFRLVLTESVNSTKSGRLKEILGSYDPRKTTDSIKADRVKYWLGVGAKATGTVHNLLITHKIIDGKKINVLPRKTPIKKDAEPVKEAALPTSEAVGTPTENVGAVPAEAPAPVEAPASEPVIESTEASA
ncbi:30S ribosomal protein S16 [Candidatus Parcubacteria bacterium]|nr:30S ribosomal protein S16 [Candidatus Parcubacteria bacterium]